MNKKPPKENEVKRNDPCPCGSGKKYKKCCLPKKDATVDLRLQRYKDTDIQLNAKLAKFAYNHLSEEEREYTFSHFFIPEAFEEIFKDADLGEEELEQIEDLMHNIYLPWLLYDYYSDQDSTVAEMYLETKSNKLDELEKELIKGYVDSYPSYYQAMEVKKGCGLQLKDIITGDQFFVNDVSSSEGPVKWDILYTRIVKVGQYRIFAGNGILFPPSLKQDIQDFITDLFKECKRKIKDIPYEHFQKRFASTNNHLLLILIRRMVTKPELVNFDGEELVFAEAYYEIANVQELVSVLDKMAEFDQTEIARDRDGQITQAEYTWVKKGKKRKDNISMGSFQIRKDKLTVSCNSKERLEKIKNILATKSKDLLKYKATTYRDVESMLEEAKQKPLPKPKDEIPIEIQKQIMEEFQVGYQREWLESSIPALDDLTPRQASKTKKGKLLLEELLNSIENRQLRSEKEFEENDGLPVPRLDIQEVREDLGLF